MESNRNISILLLNAVANKAMDVALPLAGSGIRGLRFLQELKKGKIDIIFINDKKEGFVKNFKDNLKLNQIKTDQIKIFNQDANDFLLNQHCASFCGYFDYIDIDPFGSPNPFLSSAVGRIKRGGILAVTATDTAALTGTYLRTTKRKYWASSLKNYLMHETGLRILVRKVQLQGVQFDKTLTPILSYHKDHYFRVYFVSDRGKGKCDQLIKEHQYLLYCNKCLNFKVSHYNKEECTCGKDFDFAGPLWVGKLFDSKLLLKMAKSNKFAEEQKFLDLLVRESKKDLLGFYDLHRISKTYKIKTPKMEQFLKKVKGTRTHFSKYGVKTEKGIKKILKK
tara:strand:- start:2208 stop:3218 length:1011 start_codon:yes stop_codon:yes gene_type:complete